MPVVQGVTVALRWGGVAMFQVSSVEPNLRAPGFRQFARGVLIVLLVGTFVAGCTRYELQSKAAAYNEAVGGAANEAILLNAVRASQRAPMSFTSLGQVLAQPTFSGSASSTVNFDPFGLTSYSITPMASVAGGFQSFTMDNLNTDKFMTRMRAPISYQLIRYFEALKWPEELTELLFIASIKVSPGVYKRIEHASKAECERRKGDRTIRICDAIDRQQAQFDAAHCYPYDDRGVIFNTARNICDMATLQIFLRRARLLYIRPLDQRIFTVVPRTTLGMLYYLGELIAAQNYSDKPYTPEVLIGTADGLRSVLLFEVRRGVSVTGAAVVTNYSGETFYIPRPDLGSVDEARSMQVLDFVSQVISIQTQDKDIPKISAISVVGGR
jgi:hypothetical protein